MWIYKITNSLKIALALHSSRRKKATVVNKIQIGEDLKYREAKTHVSNFSFFDHNYLLQLYFCRCQGIFITNRVF